MGLLHDGGRVREDYNVLKSSLTTTENQFRSFRVPGLESASAISSGSPHEILLLAWLVVLLRTREDGQISFEWAHKSDDCHEATAHHTLAGDQIIQNLKSSIKDAELIISRHISAVSPRKSPNTSTPSSILLSTNVLSRISEHAKDDETVQLEIRLHNDSLRISPLWQSKGILAFTVTRYINSLVEIVRECISRPDASVDDLLRPISWDLDEIWRWNGDLPPTHDSCMHDVIAEQARRLQDKIAISSWDGDLTYAQIEQWSTYMAGCLRDNGIKLHDFVPVCFEKSRWTIVAVLAVMKAGATLVMMDPTLPLARLQNMAKQVSAKVMLSSRMQLGFSTTIMPEGTHLVVESDAFTTLIKGTVLAKLSIVPSSVLMYIIFTSGSTGTPKGVKISHQTYTSSAFPRAKAVGYTEDSRVLDFASYAFDVSIDSMLLTLGNGGCLCIPSDDDRLNDINGVIRNMRINYAGLTPSVARILEPDVIKSLTGGLGLGGEAASATDVTQWGRDARIVIGYGPCECTIGCTINSSAATGRDYVSIGHGNGANMWIVDPTDHETLMPVGAVGELLVEGPIVGQGYLDDPEKTTAAFIEDPSWLVNGHKEHQGRSGRLYKTGDLGSYDPDGSGDIVFAGRKDTQVKLRGQRVELGEIESQLRARLPTDTNVIAEVIKPQSSGNQPTLVAFLVFDATKSRDNTNLQIIELNAELRKIISDANAELTKVLPRYMIPTAYIPVSTILVLISGKTDRKRLREFGATVDLHSLDHPTKDNSSKQLNDQEQRLREAWAQTLRLDSATIGTNDIFFALGGDSVAAMKLVSVCRTQGLEVSVTDMFNHPTLTAMASAAKTCVTETQTELAPFSLISRPVYAASTEAASACSVSQADIEDIYPCTPTQESLFTFSLKSAVPYVAQRVASIPANISTDFWKDAWEKVIAAHPILRSRVAQLQEPGLQQVVLKGSISWNYADDLAQYLEADRDSRMDLGQSLARYAIIEDTKDSKRYMVWTVHHVLYDGWSEPLILEKISKVLCGQQIESASTIKHFVKHIRDTNEITMQDFWRSELDGAVGPQFPRLPSRDYFPTPNGLVSREVPFQMPTGSPFTLATLIRGAWALVASMHTGSEDIVFGETLSGRDIPLPGVECVVGPLIATVPMRVQVSRACSVESYLKSVQQSMLARVPYQHMGMQNIRKVSQDAQIACETGTGMVIQPEPEYAGNELGFTYGDVVKEALHFNPYPLMLAFGIKKGGYRVCASFDKSLIEVEQMERILAQLETTCSELSSDPFKQLSEVVCLPESELSQIWSWNSTAPLSFHDASKKLSGPTGIKQGSLYPRAVIPWVCNPRDLSQLSPIGCIGELYLEGHCLPGDVIDAPAWLMAGSADHAGRRGKLHATGDLVRLNEDGSLTFVRRKGITSSIQGQALDSAELDLLISKHLPSSSRAALAVRKSASGAESLVLLAQNISGHDQVTQVAQNHDIGSKEIGEGLSKLVICSQSSRNLIVAMGKLDKSIRSSLASYMVPSSYIIVESMPSNHDHKDRTMLNQLASAIPDQVLDHIRQNYNSFWAAAAADTSLTEQERILRSFWAKILRIDEAQIDPENNFFRLGGDSVLAMKLVSALRAEGHTLTVADIFQHMRLEAAAKRLKIGQAEKPVKQEYKPFSTLGIDSGKLQRFLTDDVRSQLQDSSWAIEDVMPGTDTQETDILATINPPRTAVQYTMLHLPATIDIQRLLHAVEKLIATHAILRTVFIRTPTSFLQVVLSFLPSLVTTTSAPELNTDSFCTTDISSPLPLGAPWTSFTLLSTPTTHTLVLRLSHAQYDGVSLPRLLSDLSLLYSNSSLPSSVPFQAYISRTLTPRLVQPAQQYWSTLLRGTSLSPPPIPAAKAGEKALFLSAPVSITELPAEVTTATLLTTSWAIVLARRLGTREVVFGAVTGGRAAGDENVVGPCYQIAPVRVTLTGQTIAQLLEGVQRQTAASTGHDFLGLKRIADAVGWPEEGRKWGCIVHYQDVEEEGEDGMEFGGEEVKVGIKNPAGESAEVFKIVSFRKGGEMMVGVVGAEEEREKVEGVLEELRVTVEEVAAGVEDVIRT